MTFDLGEEVQKANQDYPSGCPACRGVRFKRCASCGQSINSYSDHRVGRLKPQVYETMREWREVEGERDQDIPERKLQP